MEAVQAAFTRAGMIQYQDYNKRTEAQLVKDLNEAHTRIKKLLKTGDQQQRVLTGLKSSNRNKTLMLWIQGAALTALWGLVVRLMVH